MLELNQNSDFKDFSIFTIPNTFYDLSFEKNNSDLWGKQAIDQAIEIILMTEPKERLFNLAFGSPLYLVFFENSVNAQEIVNTALNIIEYWVPIRILRDKIDFENNSDEHYIAFKIPYISNDGLISSVFSRKIRQ